MKRPSTLVEITIDKLVHGGQGMGSLPDGRKVFVWNALPGEKVAAGLIKSKRSYAEAIAEEILQPSSEREEPREVNYLATSPWQIMTIDAENRYKKDIVQELFGRESMDLPTLEGVQTANQEWHYRNKMEYSFWGDESGLHLALHRRGSHGKQIVSGSQLAMPAIDEAANQIIAQLTVAEIRAGQLKTIIVRCDQRGNTAAALFVKPEQFFELELPTGLQGLRVYHSDPRSPASVRTKLLYELGDCRLQDELLGKSFTYDVDSFFQVNLPVYEKAIGQIKEFIDADELTDMYAGVGSLGLSVAKAQVDLVELDSVTAAMARHNAEQSGIQASVIEASTEKALDYIRADRPIIFDPPRSGLHPRVVARLREILPPKIAYLSCNPATHARDLALLKDIYNIEDFRIYNFFPRTPHIETLALLRRR